jgi:hypothetical protein
MRDVSGTLSERDKFSTPLPSDSEPSGIFEPRLLFADTLQTVRLQLVLGDDRAEVSLDDLKRLENRPLC